MCMVPQKECECLPPLQDIAVSVDNAWLRELGLYEIGDVGEISLSIVGPVIDSLCGGIRGVQRF